MKISYSRIETFKMCPYKYYLSYIKGLKTKFNLDPTNALVLGTALHTGIEQNVLAAIKGYYSNYPSVTPLMVNEGIKLEIMIEKAKAILPEGQYELLLEDDDFKGYMDLLVDVTDTLSIKEQIDFGNIRVYDLYDFKYSNAVDRYKESGQLHVYKYWFEKLNPNKRIRNMSFVVVPKANVKREEEESLSDYRERIIKECESLDINIVPIEYDPNKVIDFLTDTKHCIECQEFNKNPSKLCYFCDFKKYCQSDGKEDGNIIYPTKNESEEI